MTLSSASINKRVRVNNLALAGLGILLVSGAGCAHRSRLAPPHTVYGYADLNALVRSRPGWNGLERYDAALARLDAEARLPRAGQPDPKLAVLPALTLGAGADMAGSSAARTAQIGPRLSAVEASLAASLDRRRKMARAEQVRRQQELWRRNARRLFPVPARTAEIGSDLNLQLLQANVAALTQTLSHWDNSVPPAPKLARLRKKVEADRARLQALIARRIGTREAARAARVEAINRTRQARLDYVAAQGAALAARLQAEDAHALGLRTQSLSRERQALLSALAAPEVISVPAAGDAGALALPRSPGTLPPSLSADSLRTARNELLAQRGRWVQYLYDDTRASALDAAGKKHWNITFGPPRPGDRDLTTDLEQALGQG
jgi:hypothetical protein